MREASRGCVDDHPWMCPTRRALPWKPTSEPGSKLQSVVCFWQRYMGALDERGAALLWTTSILHFHIGSDTRTNNETHTHICTQSCHSSAAAACTLPARHPLNCFLDRECEITVSGCIWQPQAPCRGPICSRGPHLSSANQHRHSSHQRFTSVDHLKSCPVGSKIKFCLADSSLPQNEPQFTCPPSTKACHRHTDNSVGNSTVELPHEASMMFM